MLKKIKHVIICAALTCVLLTGCNTGGNKKAVATPTPTSTSKISINFLNGDMSFSKITAFDFMSNKQKTFNGKGSYLYNSKTSVSFIKGGDFFEIGVNKDITTRPSSINIYTNKKRTSSKSYNIKYS